MFTRLGDLPRALSKTPSPSRNGPRGAGNEAPPGIPDNLRIDQKSKNKHIKRSRDQERKRCVTARQTVCAGPNTGEVMCEVTCEVFSGVVCGAFKKADTTL